MHCASIGPSRAKESWTETCVMVIQNKPFPLLIWLSEVFCYSDRNLTNTAPLSPVFGTEKDCPTRVVATSLSFVEFTFGVKLTLLLKNCVRDMLSSLFILGDFFCCVDLKDKCFDG
jgi:hypothetical protein